MAVNQVTLFFYPPRWQQRLTRAPFGRTDTGENIQIVDAVPVEGVSDPPLQATVMKAWLTEQGFAPVTLGEGWLFERGQVVSIFGPEVEIEVSLGEKQEEVTELRCRFTLPRSSAPAISEWAEFVAAMCARFQLRLGNGQPLP